MLNQSINGPLGSINHQNFNAGGIAMSHYAGQTGHLLGGQSTARSEANFSGIHV